MDHSDEVNRQPLVLASASPRRQQLLREWNIPFEVMLEAVKELTSKSAPQLTPVELAYKNALLKAVAVAKSMQAPGRWILGADTIVVVDKRILGKPVSLDEAREFLRLLSKRAHQVITGCVLLDPAGMPIRFHQETDVTFKTLSAATIERYITEVNVLDKAGAYALQEHAELIIERVEGSWNNVIGLPVLELETILKERDLL